MRELLLNQLGQISSISLNLTVGFILFWLGQLVYQKLFRHLALNLELFVKDNPAVAIALVGYYLGIAIALGSVIQKTTTTWLELLSNFILYGATVIFFMFAGAWIGDRMILRQCDTAREIKEERNIGAAFVEAGIHIANGLILYGSLSGDTGSWLVGFSCWLIGLAILVLVSYVYPFVTKYNVFSEIENRNNPAAGVAFAGLLIATGNIVRVAFSADFENWLLSFTDYSLTLLFCLILLIIIRWIADLILVPGVTISDEIVNQQVPNVGAGLIEAFAYIATSFLIAWTV